MNLSSILLLAAALSANQAIATPAAQCIECHGEDGIASSSGYPNLAGQRQDYLVKQLRDFRAGRRSSPFMNIVAARISENELTGIAAYFASRPASAGAPAIDDMAARTLYQAACASCHGANASGAGQVPALRGQKMFYLREQLLNWRQGQRNNSPGRVMNQAADPLSDADIDALARYLSLL
jgi:cytochrome c553